MTMNATLNVIENRYTCRDFNDKEVGADLLKLIAAAGVQSPSANNSQKWHIIVITDKNLINELETAGMKTIKAMPDQAVYERIMSRGGLLFYNAQALIAVAVDASGRDLPSMDCGICVENMTIAAASLGVASCICGLAGLAFEGDNEKKFNEKLKFPSGYKLGMSILLGYEKAPGKPHEPDYNKITYIA